MAQSPFCDVQSGKGWEVCDDLCFIRQHLDCRRGDGEVFGEPVVVFAFYVTPYFHIISAYGKNATYILGCDVAEQKPLTAACESFPSYLTAPLGYILSGIYIFVTLYGHHRLPIPSLWLNIDIHFGRKAEGG